MAGASNLWQFLSQLFFPTHCVACRRPGESLCASCHACVQRFSPPRCPRCDMPTRAARADACAACHHASSHLTGLRVVGPHEEPLRGAIHALKYLDGRAVAAHLGTLLVERWAEAEIDVDAVLAVPLHAQRERERGYNQALLLAEVLATTTGLPLLQGLERVRATPPQVGLGREARRTNVAAAFAATPAVAGKRLLLVDDVCTTGSTLDACAETLRRCGAGSVWALVLARPILPLAST